jgi:hypothetical protein
MTKILLGIGYLFEKKEIIFEDKKYDYYEMIDYVAGIDFCTIFNTNAFHILTGDYKSLNAGVFHKNGEERHFMVFDDYEKFSYIDLKANNWIIDFYKIRDAKLQKYDELKYYYWDNKKGIIKLVDNIELLKNLIDTNNKNNARKRKI